MFTWTPLLWWWSGLWKASVSASLCVCVYVWCAHACVHICVHVYGVRDQYWISIDWVSSSIPLLLIFWNSLSLNLEHMSFTSLTGQQSLGSSFPQYWLWLHTHIGFVLFHVDDGAQTQSSCLHDKHLPTESFFQPSRITPGGDITSKYNSQHCKNRPKLCMHKVLIIY